MSEAASERRVAGGGAAGAESRRRAGEAALVAFLLLAFALQSGTAQEVHSASSDEAAHIAGGVSHLLSGHVRLNPEHPPLVKALAALPLLTLDLEGREEAATATHQWRYGRTLLYSNDTDRVLRRARWPVLLLALGLGLVVWRFARELFGPLGGGVALFLFAFSPNLLAHSHFVTMDVPLAFFMLAACHALWRWTVHKRTPDLVWAGLATGAALATKFSGLALGPAFVLVMGALLLRWARDPSAPERPERPLHFVAVTGVAVAALAGLVVWAAYGFPLEPAFYLDGLSRVNANRTGLPVYLLGDFHVGSVASYFLVTTLVKTPEPVLLAVLASAVLGVVRRDRPGVAIFFLTIPPLVFFVITSALAANLGHRYVLPVLGFAFVFAGRLALVPMARPLRVALCVVLGAWQAGFTLASWPDHVAYFNRLAGGPERGPELLADSNLDWGHNLERLAAWAEAEGVREFRWLDPWSSGDPAYYGLEASPLTLGEWASDPPEPGVYVLNVHSLVYGRRWHRERGLPTDWIDRYEPAARVGHAYYVYRFNEETGAAVRGSPDRP